MHHGNVSPQIAQGLLNLQKRIKAANIPPSKLDETINVAVWNIREFGKAERTRAALHYIAEILGQFDLIALVELRDNLHDLACVLPFLGESWDIVYSDWIEDAGGNNERTAFLFDTRAVTFNGLAAEIDAPRQGTSDPDKTKTAREYLATQSFWRAPYMCSFRAGNFDFIAIAAHARWGSSDEGRRAELQLLADWIETRFQSKYVEDHDLLVMGDFNIPKLNDPFYTALTHHGLRMPPALVELKAGDRVLQGTNLKNTARYDQILYRPTAKDRFTTHAGTLDFYAAGDAIKELFPDSHYDETKFSFQLSDHFPLWVQVKTDIDGDRLDQIAHSNHKG